MTTWTPVTPGDTHYKHAQRGQLYAGFKGVYAGSLTVPLQGDGTITATAFYAGLIGVARAVTEWTDIDLEATTWTDV